MTGERERGNQGERNGAVQGVSMGCAQALARIGGVHPQCGSRIKEIVESDGKSAFNPMDLLHRPLTPSAVHSRTGGAGCSSVRGRLVMFAPYMFAPCKFVQCMFAPCAREREEHVDVPLHDSGAHTTQLWFMKPG